MILIFFSKLFVRMGFEEIGVVFIAGVCITSECFLCPFDVFQAFDNKPANESVF